MKEDNAQGEDKLGDQFTEASLSKDALSGDAGFSGKKIAREQTITLHSVNNFLKSPADMERDFSQQVNFQDVKIETSIEVYLQAYKDGSINIHAPIAFGFGTMEENY